MSDQFQYYLNWDHVTSDKYCDGKKINKGIQFENLVECLLPKMFPGEKWLRTKSSYDGKKDFVYPDNTALKEEKWAECKNYESNLSINIIAPTLIMAAIHEIKQVYIFSRSPLNENAVEALISFTTREKQQVHIIDGNLLESIICRCSATREIIEFFPNTDFSAAEQQIKQSKIRVICTLKNAQGLYIPNIFYLGESFRIQVLIQNITCEAITLQLSEREKQLDITVAAGQIYEYSINDSILLPQNISYPIKIRDKSTANVLWEKDIQLTVSEESYLFWSGHQANRTKDAALQHLQSKTLTPLILTAGSGCGKSLLLRLLLEDKRIQSTYRILQLNPKVGRNAWAREFFAQMAGVCNSQETPSDQQEDENEILSILLNGYATSAKEIAEKIISFYSDQQPYLLVIDDIQKIKSAYYRLITELENCAKTEEKDLYYLITLNTDELSLNDLLVDLGWNEDFQNREYVEKTLCKFGKKDIISFIQTCYGIQDIASAFENHVQEITPLELSTFCRGLKADHIIEKVPDQQIYQIVKPLEFQDMVDSKLYSDHVLETLLRASAKNIHMEDALKYLYLTGSICDHSGICSRKSIGELLAKGILKYENGKYVFYHSKIREIIGKELEYLEEDYADIFDNQDTSQGAKALCALHLPNPMKKNILFLASFFTSIGAVDSPEQRYDICQSILTSAEMLANSGILHHAISFVAANYTDLNEESGYLKFQKLLHDITCWAIAKPIWDIDEDTVEHIAFFIKKFWDRTLSTHQQEQYKDYFTNIEQCFKGLKHISAQRRAFWLCHYANRSAIAMDRASSPLIADTAEIAAQYALSQEYCSLADSPNDLQLQLIVDNFYRYYVYRHNLDQYNLCQIEQELSKITELEEHECEIRDYHLLLIRYLRSKLDTSYSFDPEKFLSDHTELLNKCQTEFYQIKLYQLKIYVLCDLNRFIEAEKVLETALALVYRKDMRTIIYRFTYIGANILTYRNAAQNDIRAKKTLALRQMLNTYGSFVPSLEREVFLLKELIRDMNEYAPKELQKLITAQDTCCSALLQALKEDLKSSTKNALFQMRSYFIINGIDFPII